MQPTLVLCLATLALAQRQTNEPKPPFISGSLSNSVPLPSETLPSTMATGTDTETDSDTATTDTETTMTTTLTKSQVTTNTAGESTTIVTTETSTEGAMPTAAGAYLAPWIGAAAAAMLL